MTISDGHGGTATQTVSVTITGTNDAAMITGAATGNVVEDTAATLITAGKLNIADVDTGESSFVAQASAAGTYGTFVLNADGNWTYSANNSQAAIQQLGAGQTLTDSFKAVSKDGTATQTVSIIITGTNDAPTLGFRQGFELNDAGVLDGDSGWYGNVQVVDSFNGIAAPDGGSFAVLTQGASPDDTGPFTRFDGYRSDFVEGLTSEVKVYLSTDWAAGEGFDYSVARQRLGRLVPA